MSLPHCRVICHSSAVFMATVTAMAAPSAAETLTELLSRESAVDFGPCSLAPNPVIAGQPRFALPARFDTPGVWLTETALLVGVSRAGEVLQVVAIKLPAAISPRETVSVRCELDRITVRTTGGDVQRSTVLTWDGGKLDLAP